MQKILEKFMKKYWKNAKKTGKVRKIRQSKKVGTMQLLNYKTACDVRVMLFLSFSFLFFFFFFCQSPVVVEVAFFEGGWKEGISPTG